MDCKKKKGEEFGGWNNEGKRMFNKLKDEIKEDRKANPSWEDSFLRAMVRLAPERTNKRQRRDLTEQLEEVRTNNDLVFSDSDCDSDKEESTHDGPLRPDNGDESSGSLEL